MEQAILKQMIASTQSPNNFLQMFLRADYLLSHLRLNDLQLNCIFIIGLVFTYPPLPPFFDCIGFLIVVTPILRYTIVYNIAAVSDIKRVFTKLWVKNYRDQELYNNWYHAISTMRST